MSGRLEHGLSRHPIYRKWTGIKQRCYNPTFQHYSRYGGRGITMHDKWIDDVVLFIEYVSLLPDAMGSKMTLDRIDNDGNYEPGNLRWVNMHVQTANRSLQSRNKTGYIGVAIHRDTYKYVLTVDGKRIRKCGFKTAKEAATARMNYIISHGLYEYNF